MILVFRKAWAASSMVSYLSLDSAIFSLSCLIPVPPVFGVPFRSIILSALFLAPAPSLSLVRSSLTTSNSPLKRVSFSGFMTYLSVFRRDALIPGTVSVDSMLKVGKYCAANNKTYCLNLSAPFLIQFFKDQMMSVMPYADIVFGNETEALTFAETFNLGTTDIKKIALSLSMLPKENGSKGRLVIITQGSDPVICVENGQVLEFAAEKLGADKIKDTNGT